MRAYPAAIPYPGVELRTDACHKLAVQAISRNVRLLRAVEHFNVGLAVIEPGKPRGITAMSPEQCQAEALEALSRGPP